MACVLSPPLTGPTTGRCTTPTSGPMTHLDSSHLLATRCRWVLPGTIYDRSNLVKHHDQKELVDPKCRRESNVPGAVMYLVRS